MRQPSFPDTAPDVRSGGAFVDRRRPGQAGEAPGTERRQFASSHVELSPEAREFAQAVDAYKIRHRRRYVTFEELLAVLRDLGYRKT